jgi:Mg-chelatase subunit ChlD
MNIETILARPSVRGFQFRLGLEAYAHKVGASLGLPRVRVFWRDYCQTAGINCDGDLYLAGVPDEAVVDRKMVGKYAAYVVHELLHHKYTDFSVSGGDPYLHQLHNAVEDGWIENTGIQSGLLGNIGPLLGEMIDNMTREAIASVSDWNDARQYPYVLAVHCRKHATLKCPTNPVLTPIFDEAARRCATAASTAETMLIAKWVYDQIKQASKTNERKKPGKKGSDKPVDGATGHDQGEGKGKGADKADKPSNDPSGPVQSPDGIEPESVEPKLREAGSFGTYSTDHSLKAETHHISDDLRPDLINAPIPAKLRYEVKRLFDNSGLSDFNRNRKAGVVNVHALPTVATGNDRVFKRRLEVEGIDSAVVICLDVSGSMFDIQRDGKTLIAPAIATCRALLETLDAAGVKTAVLTFGTNIAVPKGFDRNVRMANARLNRVRAGGTTNDYTALRYAHQMLIQRTERRKIVFVITDGEGRPDAVRKQVTSGNALGVTTIGVGIKKFVDDIYGQAVTVHDIADLGNASFKQIKLAA